VADLQKDQKVPTVPEGVLAGDTKNFKKPEADPKKKAGIAGEEAEGGTAAPGMAGGKAS
jgi:hypothetical protein